MLIKLLKYDLKSTFRNFLPLLVMIAAAGFSLPFLTSSKLLMGMDILLWAMYEFFFVISVIAVPAGKFKESIDSGQAYLFMTLPASPVKNLISKLLCTAILYSSAFGVFHISVYPGLIIAGKSDLFSAANMLFYFADGLVSALYAQLFVFMVLAIASAIRKGGASFTVFFIMAGLVLKGFESIFYAMMIYLSESGMFLRSVFHGIAAAVFFTVTALILCKKYNLYK